MVFSARLFSCILGVLLAFAFVGLAAHEVFAQESAKGSLDAPPAPAADGAASSPGKIIARVAERVCPEGQEIHGGQCLPACRDGTVRHAAFPGLCTPRAELGCPPDHDQVPLPPCPQGRIRDLNNPDFCVADRALNEHISSCGPGMVFSSAKDACVSQCPEGYMLDESGACRDLYTQACAKDYQRDMKTGRCLRPGKWPADYTWICLPSCPPEAMRDVQHPTLCVEAKVACEPGFEQIGPRCLPVCAPGSTRNSYGYCMPPSCPEGSYPTLDGKCRAIACAEGAEDVNGHCLAMCAAGEARDAAGTCQPGAAEGSDATVAKPAANATPAQTGQTKVNKPVSPPEKPKKPPVKAAPPPKEKPKAKPEAKPAANGDAARKPCPEGTVRTSNGECVAG